MESARRLIIGTAGHIDHGKTALVKALTGKNTDRLKEEQERGISIDIDFAPLRFDDGTVIGIVDVPGHERFVRNMVAGSVGVDSALLVIDIREGVMPQTLEHIEILELLGVSTGVIALTKCDLVDADWLAVAPGLIREELKNTVFASSDLICTSVKSGKGIPELKNKLYSLTQRINLKDAAGFFRMPVDKQFSIPGFGTVVSGTVWHGTVRVGDHVESIPGRESSRVRGIQVHGRTVDCAFAGERAALNLAGLDKATVRRGQVIVTPGILDESSLLDVRIERSRNTRNIFHHHEIVHVHLGTAEVTGRVLLLESDELQIGSNGYAQLVLDHPIATEAGDRFVLRGGTPLTTIAGGRVIDPLPKRIHRRRRPDIVASMTAKDQNSPSQRLISEVISGQLIMESDVCRQLQVSPSDAEQRLIEMAPNVELKRIPSGWMTEAGICRVLLLIENELFAVHKQNRLANFVSRSVVVSRIRRLLTDYQTRDIDWFVEEGRIRGIWNIDSPRMCSAKWAVQLTGEEERLLGILLDVLMNGALCPPSEDDLCITYGKQVKTVQSLLFYAREQGLLVSPIDGIYWHVQVFHNAIAQIVSLSKIQKKFSVAQVRDTLSISRKYAVMLLEYLDKQGITKRIGDERILLQDVTNS